MSIDDGLTPIEMCCVNCNRDSHFLGVFCWWGVWIMVVGLAYFLAAIGYVVWAVVQ